ncbi:putative CREB/ATF bZIP transcription factor isoform 5 [Scophthalmus maximus]|uniref:Putative CREB/ATF bZIP transcription factor isoform 5 n=1 Tax=Scophthalmus maximus TaxID=52904 RepID=A0A2U9BXT0_SCOMX|nr:putative CREB/ATF bZIP transcription factor isoform 5 [Scophthalmus maximus]
MITRRRGRAVNNKESLEVEVVDAVETVEDLPSPSEGFSADDIETGGVELDDLFGIEDLKWTLGRETVSPLFDMEFADLGMYCPRDHDSGLEASTSSSPDRMTSDTKPKNRQNQSMHMINKNAIAARLNRLKKKEYVNTLEKKVGGLSTENNMLKQENSQLTKRVEELEDETRGPTQTTTTTPYPGSVSKWRRKRHLVAYVCTWTRTTSQWSSAPSVQRVQAHRSKFSSR